jgi:hypothetical protein
VHDDVELAEREALPGGAGGVIGVVEHGGTEIADGRPGRAGA